MTMGIIPPVLTLQLYQRLTFGISADLFQLRCWFIDFHAEGNSHILSTQCHIYQVYKVVVYLIELSAPR